MEDLPQPPSPQMVIEMGMGGSFRGEVVVVVVAVVGDSWWLFGGEVREVVGVWFTWGVRILSFSFCYCLFVVVIVALVAAVGGCCWLSSVS